MLSTKQEWPWLPGYKPLTLVVVENKITCRYTCGLYLIISNFALVICFRLQFCLVTI